MPVSRGGAATATEGGSQWSHSGEQIAVRARPGTPAHRRSATPPGTAVNDHAAGVPSLIAPPLERAPCSGVVWYAQRGRSAARQLLRPAPPQRQAGACPPAGVPQHLIAALFAAAHSTGRRWLNVPHPPAMTTS